MKKFAKDFFPDAKSDLFACFIERGYSLAKGAGHNAMVTMQSWMFLSSFEKMRERMFQEKTIGTMAHLGARAFGSISGEVVQTAASVLKNTSFEGYKPAYFRLLDGGEEQKRTALANGENRFDTTPQNELKKIPGSPIAYWTSPQIRRIFEQAPNLGTVAKAVVGLQTGDNDRFMRQWFEVSQSRSIYYCEDRKSALASGRKWFPYNKGGEYRRWYGNRDQKQHG